MMSHASLIEVNEAITLGGNKKEKKEEKKRKKSPCLRRYFSFSIPKDPRPKVHYLAHQKKKNLREHIYKQKNINIYCFIQTLPSTEGTNLQMNTLCPQFTHSSRCQVQTFDEQLALGLFTPFCSSSSQRWPGNHGCS